jgi:hypothetical protein
VADHWPWRGHVTAVFFACFGRRWQPSQPRAPAGKPWA